MQQQINVEGQYFYSQRTNSPSIKLSIRYPSSIPNLTYNFQLTLIVSIQKLIPKISYNQVLTQTIYTPRRQIILNNLQPSTMYQLKLLFNKKSNNRSQSDMLLNVDKTVFVFTQKKQQRQQQSLQQEQQQNVGQSYSSIVRENIKDYFNQYHNNQQQQNVNNNNNQSIKSNHYQRAHNYRPSSSTFSIRSKQQSTISSKINIINTNNKNTGIKNTNKNTNINYKKPLSQQLCNSQSLIKVIGENDSLINKKKLQKYILQARKSSSTQDYLTTKHYQCFNQMNKLYKNQKQKRQHIQKTLLVTKAINIFGEIYQNDIENGILELKTNQKTGKQFFKNDWFMGPFYSYDVNEKSMKRNNNNNNQ